MNAALWWTVSLVVFAALIFVLVGRSDRVEPPHPPRCDCGACTKKIARLAVNTLRAAKLPANRRTKKQQRALDDAIDNQP